MPTLTFIPTESGERIDSFLAAQEPLHSRSFWQRLCDAGDVLVNGEPVKSKQKVVAGREILVTLADKIDFANDTLPIIYEDDDVIVINKPAGLLTHAKGVSS